MRRSRTRSFPVRSARPTTGRSPGVAPGGGAVAAGALELLEWDATGVSDGLDDFARVLNAHAQAHADEHRAARLDDAVPPFVALDFEHRTALVQRLTAPGHPEKELWVGLALFSNMAYDSAAHMNTADALAAGHPGLTSIGFTTPGRRRPVAVPRLLLRPPLARLHPTRPRQGAPHDQRGTHRRPRYRQRLRRRDPRLPPGRRRRAGRRAGTRARGWPADEFDHDFKLGSSYTRIFDFVVGDGMSVLGGNCVGGGSVVYFATMPRAPRFVFERQGSIGRRMWPAAITRDTPRPLVRPGRRGAARHPAELGRRAVRRRAVGRGLRPRRAHRQPGRRPPSTPTMCTNCNWMMAGCRFDAKRSLLLNYLPAALAHGAEIRPLHEVQQHHPQRRRQLPGALPHRRRRGLPDPARRAARSTPRSSCSPPAPAPPR